jgi:tetratricopeptide (TPR) repeat protein
MSQRLTCLLLLLLLTVCFCLGALLQPRSLSWRGQRAQADTMLKVLLGDGRRMFANHYFVKADVYLHSGYYPSIFDQAKLQCEDHLKGHDEHAEEAHAAPTEPGHEEHDDHDEQDVFGQPKDWLDRFGRKFRITEHTHLAGKGAEREVLPWLKLSAELDPQQIETYVVAAYWLRSKLGKVKEAEEFLRDGLRANPDSHEILFELGRLFDKDLKDTVRARNVWEMALRKWAKNEATKAEPDKLILEQILTNLARLEEREGNYRKALDYSLLLKPISPHPELIEGQIQELRLKLQPSPASPTLLR